MEASCIRKIIKDKLGLSFIIGACGLEDSEYVLDMYDRFEPKKTSQGLPPEDSRTRREWVSALMDKGENFLVWHDEIVVGHAVLTPDFITRDAEFLIFVNRPYRGRGLGTELTRAAVERAREIGLELIWLTVEGHNFWAISLYRKFGFVFCDDQGWDRMMILRL